MAIRNLSQFFFYWASWNSEEKLAERSSPAWSR